jgi:hypothetical protein
VVYTSVHMSARVVYMCVRMCSQCVQATSYAPSQCVLYACMHALYPRTQARTRARTRARKHGMRKKNSRTRRVGCGAATRRPGRANALQCVSRQPSSSKGAQRTGSQIPWSSKRRRSGGGRVPDRVGGRGGAVGELGASAPTFCDFRY